LKVVIVGGGKVGFYLAKTLLEHGHNPIIVEIDRQVCLRVAGDLDIPVISGDGTTLQVLELAMTDADVFASVTGKDEDNLIACQLAKQYFKIERTVARANNPKNAEIMRQLGVDTPVSATNNIARLIERELNTSVIRQLLSLNSGDVSLIEFDIPQEFKNNGITLTNLETPVESTMVAVYHSGKLIVPRGNTKLFKGDRVVILIKDEVMHELYEVFDLKEGEQHDEKNTGFR
jgi:trk system potassium uptake protein TrkA